MNLPAFKITGTNAQLKAFLSDCLEAGIPVSTSNTFFRDDYEHCLIPAYIYAACNPEGIPDTKLQLTEVGSYDEVITQRYDIGNKHQRCAVFDLAFSLAQDNPVKEGRSNSLTDTPVEDAIAVLIEALIEDHEYRYGWQANIAVAFQDAVRWEKASLPDAIAHKVSNRAALHFLGLLCHRDFSSDLLRQGVTPPGEPLAHEVPVASEVESQSPSGVAQANRALLDVQVSIKILLAIIRVSHSESAETLELKRIALEKLTAYVNIL